MVMSSISAVADRDLPGEILEIVVFHAPPMDARLRIRRLTGASYGGKLVNLE